MATNQQTEVVPRSQTLVLKNFLGGGSFFIAFLSEINRAERRNKMLYY
ncbi:hypothetical protein G3A_06120 [Bacillus sp. 17376]|nr:hypothetical protein G3A_06120 [Bacillus sp. 17376]